MWHIIELWKTMQVVKTWVHWKCMDEWLAFSNLLLLLTLVNKSFTLPQLLLVILYITNIFNK